MADLSILEFGVYGLITYSSLLMIIITVIKEAPLEKPGKLTNSIWLIPGIICAFILASSSVSITTDTISTVNTITAINTSEVWTEQIVQTNSIVLRNEVWVAVHLMIFLILIVYVITRLLNLFTQIR